MSLRRMNIDLHDAPRKWSIVSILLAVIFIPSCEASALSKVCRPFMDIYSNGRDLCENIFSQSFKYVPLDDPEYHLAYSMWWLNTSNENDLVTQARMDAGLVSDALANETLKKCHLVGLHKRIPGPEIIPHCFPFEKNACCLASTVSHPEGQNSNYGDAWRWDRCGPLSRTCEMFFIYESCAYECDPNFGLFRKYTGDSNHSEWNAWEMEGMPIKGAYCDSWWEACKHDLFCGHANGSYFECAKLAREHLAIVAPALLPPGAVVGVSVAACVLFSMLIFIIFIIYRERVGKPYFNKLSSVEVKPYSVEKSYL